MQPLGWTLNSAGEPPQGSHQTPQQGPHGQQGPPPQHQGQQQPPSGHDPLGQHEYESVSITDYQLPKSRSRWWLAGVAVVVVAGLGAAAIWTSGRPQPTAEGSPTPSPSQRVLPSSVPSGNAVAFASETDGSEGFWEIQKSEWTDRGLELMIKVTVTKGTFGYSFFCLDNATTDDYDPANIPDSNVLRPGTLNEGESAQGLVVFRKDKGDTMVYLANRFGRQVSALAIDG